MGVGCLGPGQLACDALRAVILLLARRHVERSGERGGLTDASDEGIVRTLPLSKCKCDGRF